MSLKTHKIILTAAALGVGAFLGAHRAQAASVMSPPPGVYIPPPGTPTPGTPSNKPMIKPTGDTDIIFSPGANPNPGNIGGTMTTNNVTGVMHLPVGVDSYVKRLEERVAALEAIVQKLSPGFMPVAQNMELANPNNSVKIMNMH